MSYFYSGSLEDAVQSSLKMLGRFSRRVPYLRSIAIVRMTEFLEHAPDTDLYSQGKKPQELRFELLHSTLVALFLTEDFARLRSGVQSLRAAYSRGLEFGTNRLDEWFDARRSLSGAWINGGVLSFDADGLDGLVERIWVHLFRVSASVACLSLMARPSSAFQQQLHEILGRTNEPAQRLLPYRSGSGKLAWRIAMLDSATRRREDCDRLLSAMRRAVAREVGRHIDAGWASGGSLPSIETFGHWSSEEALNTVDREFWRSVRLDRRDPFNYFRDDGISLFSRAGDDDGPGPIQHRLLVSIPTLLKGKDIRGYGNEDSAVEMTLFDRVGRLAIPVVFLEHTRRMEDTAGRMRAELAPQLSRATGLGRLPLRWSRAFFHVQELNRLEFDRNRVQAEIDWSAMDAMTHYDLRPFVRKPWGKDGREARLVDDLGEALTHRWQHLEKQITVLTEAFRSRLDYGLQQVLAWLTVMTVILAIPEALRAKVIGRLIEMVQSIPYVLGSQAARIWIISQFASASAHRTGFVESNTVRTLILTIFRNEALQSGSDFRDPCSLEAAEQSEGFFGVTQRFQSLAASGVNPCKDSRR